MKIRKKIIPILLAGGSGNRLWPLSRKSHPKQFLKLFGKRFSFFQETVLRIRKVDQVSIERLVVFTSDDYRFTVKEQLEEINVKPELIVLEPEAKNTAPSVLAATFFLNEFDNQSLLIFLPTDHKMEDANELASCIETVVESKVDDAVFLFGVKPSRVEPGYGYVKYKEREAHNNIFEVETFIEKPSEKAIIKMLQSGNHVWNSGILLAYPGILKKHFINQDPKMVGNVEKSVRLGATDLGFFRLEKKYWNKCLSVSIDYALLEKIKKILLVKFDSDWNDFGSWNSVWQESKKDNHGNYVKGAVTQQGNKGSLLISDDSEIELVAFGLEDTIVVSTSDAVLVGNRHKKNEIKSLVEKLLTGKKRQAENFKRVYRPWGFFETLVKRDMFQVKSILVNPGSRLSLQSHKYRSEHWVVVVGEAQVTLNNKVKTVKINESIYVPLGAVHRLENKTSKSLIIIEVQVGDYLEEDDIIRLEDDYSRKH